MDCIFCSIVKGDIPSYKIYEDDYVIAILDISQTTKGHTIIISKEHVKNIYEMKEEMASQIFKVLPKLTNAIKEAFNPIGMNVVVNTDKPLQSVFHFHMHIIPRYENDGFNINFINNIEKISKEEFISLKEQITKNL